MQRLGAVLDSRVEDRRAQTDGGFICTRGEVELQRQTSEREIARVLTPRELEIVRMVAQGQRTGAIASQLNVSPGTVKTHLHNIYDKLKLDGRVALTVFAREKGLV